MSSSASASLEGKTLERDSRDRRHDAVRLLLLGSVRARHGVVRAGQGTPRRSARETLHDIEHGGNENAEIAAFIADRIVRCHLKTMARMNVDYDLLTWEGDILRLKFWAQAFDVLKAKGAVYLQTEGRLTGCWVMPIQEDARDKSQVPRGRRIPNHESPSRRSDPTEEEEEREKVIVRSNGVVTYVGKDIAYQFWKLGLLGKDFHYRDVRDAAARSAVGDMHDRRRGATIRCSAARPTSTTSSTCGSRICRSC